MKKKIKKIIRTKRGKLIICLIPLIVIFILLFFVQNNKIKDNNDDINVIDNAIINSNNDDEIKLIIKDDIVSESSYIKTFPNKLIYASEDNNNNNNVSLITSSYILLINENNFDKKLLSDNRIDETFAYIVNNDLNPNVIINYVLINLKSCEQMPKTVNAIVKQMNSSPLPKYMYRFSTSSLRKLDLLRTNCRKIINK